MDAANQARLVLTVNPPRTCARRWSMRPLREPHAAIHIPTLTPTITITITIRRTRTLILRQALPALDTRIAIRKRLRASTATRWIRRILLGNPIA